MRLLHPGQRIAQPAILDHDRGIPQRIGQLVAGLGRQGRAFQRADGGDNGGGGLGRDRAVGVPDHRPQQLPRPRRIVARPQQIAAHFGHACGEGIKEPPPRQDHRDRVSLAALADPVLDRQADADRQIGPRMAGEIGRKRPAERLARARTGQRQGQRQRLARLGVGRQAMAPVGGGKIQRDLGPARGHAVVVGGAEALRHAAIRAPFGQRGKLDRRRGVRGDSDRQIAAADADGPVVARDKTRGLRGRARTGAQLRCRHSLSISGGGRGPRRDVRVGRIGRCAARAVRGMVARMPGRAAGTRLRLALPGCGSIAACGVGGGAPVGRVFAVCVSRRRRGHRPARLRGQRSGHGGRHGHVLSDILFHARALAIQAEAENSAFGDRQRVVFQRVQVNRRAAGITGRFGPAFPRRPGHDRFGRRGAGGRFPAGRQSGQPLPGRTGSAKDQRHRQRRQPDQPQRVGIAGDKPRIGRDGARLGGGRACLRQMRPPQRLGPWPAQCDAVAQGRQRPARQALIDAHQRLGIGRATETAPSGEGRRAERQRPGARHPWQRGARQRADHPQRQCRERQRGQRARGPETACEPFPPQPRQRQRRRPARGRGQHDRGPRRGHSQSGMRSRASISSMLGRGRITA